MAGCVLAAELAKAPGLSIELFERSERLGGLHHSVVINGSTYDIGPFFFDEDHQVFSSFPGLINHFVTASLKQMSVTDGGKLDLYPLSIRGYLSNHGAFHFAAAIISIVFAKFRDRNRSDLPSFIRYYIGDLVYKRSGLQVYIQRLYSLRDDEVDLVFAEQRMGDLRKRASIRSLFWNILGLKKNLGLLHSANAFARPSGGFCEAYGYIEQHLLNQGVVIHKGVKIDKIERSANKYVTHLNGKHTEYDVIFSTVPIPVIGRLLSAPITYQFETVTLLSLFYRCQGSALREMAVLYNFCTDGNWKRITNFSNIYGQPDEDTKFTVEIPIRSDHIDVEAQRLRFEEHFAKLNLSLENLSFQGSHVTASAYPVFRAKDIAAISVDIATIDASGIRTCGRQGRFEYLTSKQVAKSAASTAEELIRDLSKALA